MSNDGRIPWRQVEKPEGGIPAEDLSAEASARLRLVPWTTTTSDGPALMWDDHDNLMLIEETN